MTVQCYNAVQGHTAVPAYLKSKRLLPFAFAQCHRSDRSSCHITPPPLPAWQCGRERLLCMPNLAQCLCTFWFYTLCWTYDQPDPPQPDPLPTHPLNPPHFSTTPPSPRTGYKRKWVHPFFTRGNFFIYFYYIENASIIWYENRNIYFYNNNILSDTERLIDDI